MSKVVDLHADQEGHLPNWSEDQALHTNLKKTQRLLIEAARSLTERVTNVSPGFFKLHDSLSERLKKVARRYDA